MSDTKIEWAEAVWNPVVGCTKVSAGCANCYAERMAMRLDCMGVSRYVGITKDGKWTGKIALVEDVLEAPLRWKKPRRIFVNSMSDLFHADVPFDYIDRVFAVMALCPQHQFLVLTKRAERMAKFFSRTRTDSLRCDPEWDARQAVYSASCDTETPGLSQDDRRILFKDFAWPLHNVWLGVSVEDQAAADERVPHLLRCPAAVRFLSCEPLLGPVDLLRVDAAGFGGNSGHKVDCIRKGYWSRGMGFVNHSDMHREFGPLHWVIVGGESGPKARPCRLEWIRDIVRQCEAADVAVFVKRVREYPTGRVLQ